MPAQMIDARIDVKILALVVALVVAAAAPLTASATDGPDEFTECRTGSYVIYLECIEANVGISSERGTAAVARPSTTLGMLPDYLFMEQNTWGADFDFAPRAAPYFPSPDDASLTNNGIPSY